MGRYDSHKHPFQMRMNQWNRNRMNTVMEKRPKSMPCHVVEVAKDFIKVAFETANGVFTPPIVKMPQQFSQFAREPTQVGDKGYGVPGHYYMGGVSGDSGGGTNFYPKGNLSTMSFNPVSHTQNRDRDYDQLNHMGGPKGWIANAFTPQPSSNSGQQGGQNGQASAAAAMNASGRLRNMNVQRSMAGMSAQAMPMAAAANGGGSSGSNGSGGQQQQQKQPDDKTQFSFDNNALATIQSKDEEHNITVDQASQKITLKIPIGEWGYAGGDGKKGKYARIMTESGPSVNFKARIG